LPCGECARENWHRQFSVAPEDAAPDGAGKYFLAGGYNYFAPTVLSGASSTPLRAADDPTLAHDESLAPFAAGKGLPALPFRVFCG
jgi:hypothetical protein